MGTEDFSPFEKDVIRWMLVGEDAVLEALRQQFAHAMVESRENTGVGMYLNFEIPKSIKGVDELLGTKARFCFGDVGAKIGAPQQEIGFLIWVLEGHLAFLECYTYGSEKWPEDFFEYHLYYFGDEHNVEELRKVWTA